MDSDIDIRCVVAGMLEGNCYVIRCNRAGEGIVIDPGDEPERISDEMKAMGIRPEVILLTHGHIDHTNAASTLRKRFRSRVVCHRLDAPMVKAKNQESLWGLAHTPCTVDQEVSEGEILTTGGKALKVLHTPGHTRGSVCYIMGNLLFSGDTLFKGSIGRTDLPGGSEREMMASLHDRIATLDDQMIVYPGHGPSTTIGEEKRLNPFLQPQW
jgi:glyoxylase-like metal-dependent hydrolase (beta-lactamase superfamily II)